MRIYLVIVEEPFFHPNFVAGIFKKRQDVLGVTLVPNITGRKSRLSYAQEQFSFFGVVPALYLGVRVSFYALLDFFCRSFALPYYFSVERAVKYYKIPIYKTANVNSKEHLDYLKGLGVDVIVSAQGQIFKEELLALPKLACLNRHSALLPKYAGFLPIFWAMLAEEEEVGVTVHKMTKKIDHGEIFAQRRIPIQKNDTMYSLYNKAFALSVEVVLEALDKMERGIEGEEFDAKDFCYFGNPKKGDADIFRKKGLKFI